MKLFVIAGEPSGDRLGGALMAGLRELRPDIGFQGIGGPAMEAEGLVSRFPMDELTLMGLAEVVPELPRILRRIDETARAIVEAAPDAVVTIDSPDFCLRVLARARRLRPDLATAHYVAPTVWAWRKGRARKMARHVEHVLALFPFEPPLMQAAGMSCDFVGHPVVSEPVASEDEARAFRARHGIAPDAPLVLALPGSRRGEIARLGPVIGAVLHRVLAARPGARVVVPSVASRAAEVRAICAGWPGAPVVLDAADTPAAERAAAFAAADAALAVSGTVTLELAAAGVPTVAIYDFAPLSRFVAYMLRKLGTLRSVVLVNLVAESDTVPEFVMYRCKPDLIAPAFAGVLDDPALRAAQRRAMALTMERLGRGDDAPGLRAARSVLGWLAARQGSGGGEAEPDAAPLP